MTDTLQPNVLTVDAQGRIGASFTGHVAAAGVDLIAGITPAPPSDRQVRWLRQSDGSVVATVYGFESGGVDGTFLQSMALGGNQATAGLLAVDQFGAQAQFTASEGPQGPSIGGSAGGTSLEFLDARGASSFPQFSDGGAHRSLIGFGRITWGGGAAAATGQLVVPVPGAVTTCVAIASANLITSAGVIQDAAVVYLAASTVGSVVLGAVSRGGALMPAGSFCTVVYLAYEI